MKLYSTPITTAPPMRRQQILGGNEQISGTARSMQFGQAVDVAIKKAGAGENPHTLAQKAELLHLELIRSGLANDGYSPTTAPSALSTTLSAEPTAASQITDIPSTSPKTSDNISDIAPGTAVILTPSVANNDGKNFSSLIARASRRYGVEESLIKAVIQTESSFKPDAVSSAGAKGLMQLMPATCSDLGVNDPFNPEQNIMAGTRLLKNLLNRYGGNVEKSLAAYNWGPGNLDRSRGRLPTETREYLTKIKNLLNNYQNA